MVRLRAAQDLKSIKLVEDWWAVLRCAWSIRLAAVVAALEVAMQVAPEALEWLPWWARVLVILAVIGARLVDQRNLWPAPDDGEAWG